ncbi:MAG TPA: winged helix-turn-helix domain-containing protein [Candidatus Saccharimonadia bacterium]|nr:winged helix-turn-helix domain-containing protein [Candidatus Saccharimonadia bacterium]
MYDSNIPIQLDQIFGALAHQKRRDMLHDLSFRPATIAGLAREHDLSLPAIHKHIRALEAAGLIIRKKAGRTNFIALNKQTLRTTQDWMMQYRTEWGNDEETLENYIAGLQQP